MARMTPDEIAAQIAKQDDIYGNQDDPSQSDDPVDIDDLYTKTMGNDLADDEDLDVAEEIENDEEDLQEGSDQPVRLDSLEDYEALENEEDL